MRYPSIRQGTPPSFKRETGVDLYKDLHDTLYDNSPAAEEDIIKKKKEKKVDN